MKTIQGFFLFISETSLVIMDRSRQPRGLAYFQDMATGPESSFTGNSSTFLSVLLYAKTCHLLVSCLDDSGVHKVLT